MRANPGLNTEQIATHLRAMGVRFRKGDENKALRSLEESSALEIRRGEKNARLHFVRS